MVGKVLRFFELERVIPAISQKMPIRAISAGAFQRASLELQR